MGLIVLFIFIAIPLIEIGLFIEVGGRIGMWPTILIVVATAIIGTALLRQQGLSALSRLQNSLAMGEPPLAPVFDGFCLLAAAILLLTPGFFTDTLGFLLFISPLRVAIRNYLSKRILFQHGPTSFTEDPMPKPGTDDVIEAEWLDVTPTDLKKSPPKDNNTLD